MSLFRKSIFNSNFAVYGLNKLNFGYRDWERQFSEESRQWSFYIVSLYIKLSRCNVIAVVVFFCLVNLKIPFFLVKKSNLVDLFADSPFDATCYRIVCWSPWLWLNSFYLPSSFLFNNDEHNENKVVWITIFAYKIYIAQLNE